MVNRAGLDYNTAPTAMQKHVCGVCNYVYDPEEGDPTRGIAPGTPFEELPETWRCPNCGSPKEVFEPED